MLILTKSSKFPFYLFISIYRTPQFRKPELSILFQNNSYFTSIFNFSHRPLKITSKSPNRISKNFSFPKYQLLMKKRRFLPSSAFSSSLSKLLRWLLATLCFGFGRTVVVWHGTSLHKLSWNRSPSQSAPPFEGTGLVQYLSRERRARFPQCLAHSDHVDHSVKAPFTTSWSKGNRDLKAS